MINFRIVLITNTKRNLNDRGCQLPTGKCLRGVISMESLLMVVAMGVDSMVTIRSTLPLSLYLTALLVRHNTFSISQWESEINIGLRHKMVGKSCMTR